MEKGKILEHTLPLLRGYEITLTNLFATFKQKIFFMLEWLFKISYPLRVFTWIIVQGLGRAFFHWEISGREIFKKLPTGGVLFVSNHHSRLDPFFIGSAIPWSYYRQVKGFRYFTAARQITRRPWGPIIWLLGSYPVYRSNGDYERSLKRTVEMMEDGQNILMFPTGKLEKHFHPDNARPGAGYLAKTLNPLIVPVHIMNTYRMNPLETMLGFTRVKVAFGQPFRYSDVAAKSDSIGEASKKIMTKVKQLEK
jgi:1-acyl-sn-glycerol-3-phosphate acyltransferase